jgi:hypothetical protein
VRLRRTPGPLRAPMARTAAGHSVFRDCARVRANSSFCYINQVRQFMATLRLTPEITDTKNLRCPPGKCRVGFCDTDVRG